MKTESVGVAAFLLLRVKTLQSYDKGQAMEARGILHRAASPQRGITTFNWVAAFVFVRQTTKAPSTGDSCVKMKTSSQIQSARLVCSDRLNKASESPSQLDLARVRALNLTCPVATRAANGARTPLTQMNGNFIF